MSELPNHITCDILSRLPLNSIFKCKRVCKAWRNIILEPYFAQLHHSRSPLSLIFYRNCDDHDKASSSHFEIFQLHDPSISGYRIARMKFARMKFSTDMYFHHMRTLVVASSCNGLILLSNFRDLVIVCNPLTAQRYILPKLPHTQRFPTAFYETGFGFGHCPTTGQYKVLRCSQTETPTRSVEFHIYTLGIDDKWRSLRYTAKPPTIYYGTALVFLNGVLHWIDYERPLTICYFDIKKEQFGSFPLPSHIIGDSSSALAVVDNQLYIHNRYLGLGDRLQFWAMKDYGDFGSWTLEWVIEASITRGFEKFPRPLKILRDGSMLMMFESFPQSEVPLASYHQVTLASYNRQTRVLKKIKYLGILLSGASVADVPCLLSPMAFDMAILKSLS